MLNLYPNLDIIFFYQTFEGFGNALWLCQAFTKVFSCSELPGLISPIMYWMVRKYSWLSWKQVIWQWEALVEVRRENISFIALAAKVVCCFFFPQSALLRTDQGEALSPVWGDQWLVQAHGHTSQAHLPRVEQISICSIISKLSVSLMLLNERLKCFTCEIKSWRFLWHRIWFVSKGCDCRCL